MFRNAMRKIASFLVYLIIFDIGIALVVLMLLNSQSTSLHLNPLAGSEADIGTFTAPLFVWLGLYFIIGLLIGGATVWIKQRKYRKMKWENIEKNETL